MLARSDGNDDPAQGRNPVSAGHPRRRNANINWFAHWARLYTPYVSSKIRSGYIIVKRLK
jgi:hypothetical protein